MLSTGRSRRRRGRTLAIVAALALGAANPPSTTAKIIIGRSIAGVKLSDSQSNVRKRLGRPSRVVPPAWIYRGGLKGGVGFDSSRRVNDVWTSSRRQRTSAGIAVGASLRRLRRAYPAARCYTLSRGKRRVVCVLRSKTSKPAVETAFWFAGRLSKIEIYTR